MVPSVLRALHSCFYLSAQFTNAGIIKENYASLPGVTHKIRRTPNPDYVHTDRWGVPRERFSASFVFGENRDFATDCRPANRGVPQGSRRGPCLVTAGSNTTLLKGSIRARIMRVLIVLFVILRIFCFFLWLHTGCL